MKIAYISFEDPNLDSGVAKKIHHQVTIWRNRGHQVDCLALAAPTSAPCLEGVHYLLPRLHTWPTLMAAQCTQEIRDLLTELQPDILYSRELPYWPGITSIIKNRCWIREVNSDAKTESEGGLLRSFGARALLRQLGEKILPRHLACEIFVTPELAQRRAHSDVPHYIVSNGVFGRPSSTREYQASEATTFVFVGSPNQRWHGVDHILDFAKQFPEYRFEIIGQPLEGEAPANVHYRGMMSGPTLSEIYSRSTVGIGTLALYRKSMNQACPLKTREYLLNGLPVIGAYDDPDLRGAEYYLQLPNRPGSLLEYRDRVVAFVELWRSRPIPADDVRHRVGMDAKEDYRLSIFKEILGSEQHKRTFNH